ncbi:MAG: hypothetical protein HC875_10480, partial [Anaerolineales bacterium]|nr:hypothetical protein [Anaerolineales bacterium]
GFAILSRKEKALREREAKLNEQTKQVQEAVETMERLKQDPSAFFELMTKFGFKLEDVITKSEALYRNDPDAIAVRGVKDEVAELKRKLAEKEKNEARLHEEQQISEGRSMVKEYAKSNSDKFELINAKQAFDQVFDVMVAYFEETNGKILSEHDACLYVESELEKEAQRELESLRGSKKFASIFGGNANEKSPSLEKEKSKLASVIDPLANGRTSVIPQKGDNVLTEQDRKAKAIRLIEQLTREN